MASPIKSRIIREDSAISMELEGDKTAKEALDLVILISYRSIKIAYRKNERSFLLKLIIPKLDV